MLRYQHLKTYAVSAKILRCSRGFAAKPAAATTSKSASTVLPQQKEDKTFFDTDTEKLQKYACISHFKEPKHPELKPDSEYPDWLWELYIGDLRPLHELDPQTDWEYWKRVHRLAVQAKIEEMRHAYNNRYTKVLYSWKE